MEIKNKERNKIISYRIVDVIRELSSIEKLGMLELVKGAILAKGFKENNGNKNKIR